jgi:hypothetical protein
MESRSIRTWIAVTAMLAAPFTGYGGEGTSSSAGRKMEGPAAKAESKAGQKAAEAVAEKAVQKAATKAAQKSGASRAAQKAEQKVLSNPQSR